ASSDSRSSTLPACRYANAAAPARASASTANATLRAPTATLTSDPAFRTSISGIAPCIGRPGGRRKPFAARVPRRSVGRWAGDRGIGAEPPSGSSAPGGVVRDDLGRDLVPRGPAPAQGRLAERGRAAMRVAGVEDGLADPKVTARDRDLRVAHVAAEDLARVAH